MALDLKPLFKEADIRAERTVSIIRILIALALSVALVATVPIGGNRPPGLMPFTLDLQTTIMDQGVLAALTIAAYLGLGVLSLALISFGRYRGWMAWPFATMDAAVALASVWISLLNVGFLGAYAPLLPSTWLLAIVLAFGTLRYNPALQAYLTVLVGLGLAFVVWMNDGFLPLSFVYRSEDVAAPLLVAPPTIMRILMLGAAGLIMTLAVLRSTRLLRRATAEAARRDNLVRYLPRAIADLLAEGTIDELRHGRRDELAVLFVDVRGFTGLAEGMDTRALAAFMTEYRRRISRAAEAEGGVVDKYVGDGAMIVFGLDAPRDDDAARAVACMHRINAELEDWNRARAAEGLEPVRLAIGGHWGKAFCGAVGDESRLEFTVLGDVVNVASRLEARAKTEDAAAVVSGVMLKQAGPDETRHWHSLGMSSLRGRAGDMELFRLRPAEATHG